MAIRRWKKFEDTFIHFDRIYESGRYTDGYRTAQHRHHAAKIWKKLRLHAFMYVRRNTRFFHKRFPPNCLHGHGTIAHHVHRKLPRDAMHKRGLCHHAVVGSVCPDCPSRSCTVSKRLKIRPKLLWNANRKPYPSFRMVPFAMTLNDSEWLSEV